jgi:hypothetical protein
MLGRWGRFWLAAPTESQSAVFLRLPVYKPAGFGTITGLGPKRLRSNRFGFNFFPGSAAVPPAEASLSAAGLTAAGAIPAMGWLARTGQGTSPSVGSGNRIRQLHCDRYVFREPLNGARVMAGQPIQFGEFYGPAGFISRGLSGIMEPESVSLAPFSEFRKRGSFLQEISRSPIKIFQSPPLNMRGSLPRPSGGGFVFQAPAKYGERRGSKIFPCCSDVLFAKLRPFPGQTAATRRGSYFGPTAARPLRICLLYSGPKITWYQV